MQFLYAPIEVYRLFSFLNRRAKMKGRYLKNCNSMAQSQRHVILAATLVTMLSDDDYKIIMKTTCQLIANFQTKNVNSLSIGFVYTTSYVSSIQSYDGILSFPFILLLLIGNI